MLAGWAVLNLVVSWVIAGQAAIDEGTSGTSNCQIESGECVYNVNLAHQSTCGGQDGQTTHKIDQLAADTKKNAEDIMVNKAKNGVKIDLHDQRLEKLEKTVQGLTQGKCNKDSELTQMKGQLTQSQKQVTDLQSGLVAKQAQIDHLTGQLRKKDQELAQCILARNRGYPESCKQYLEWGLADGNGFYRIKPKCASKSMVVYCDMVSNGGGWTRLFYKNGAKTCYNDNIQWTKDLVECIGIKTSDFGASSSTTTLGVDQSWLLMNAVWSSSQTASIAMRNVFNCRTPTNTPWSDNYRAGYLRVQGTLQTNGRWPTMFFGCTTGIKTIGEQTGFRIGGGVHHTGEFIHGSCNDYKPGYRNSITSRWKDNNIRSIWYR